MNEPTVDHEEQEIDFHDRKGLVCFWWEDMRPREVRDLLLEVFARGVAAGKTQYTAWHTGVSHAIGVVEERRQSLLRLAPAAPPKPGVIEVLDDTLDCLRALLERGGHATSQMMGPEK